MKMDGAAASGTTTSIDMTAPDAALELRGALERILGDHVLLTIELMRAQAPAVSDGVRQAALDEVYRNTGELSAAMRQLYGAATSARFTELWAAHIKALSDYAVAIYGKDANAAKSAGVELSRIEHDLGGLLSSATNGRLSPQAASAAVREHINMLVDEANAYAHGQYVEAYRLEAEGFDHMTMLADTLAKAIALTQGLPTGTLDTPSHALQTAFARLLAAHMGLMVEAMRSAEASSPDFSSVGDTLNANTSAIGHAIGALYGHAAADAFLNLWAMHVDALMSYAVATAQHDDSARAAAQTTLTNFASRMAEFLATATHQRLPAIELTGALTQHDTHLTGQLDAYAAGNFARSDDIAAEGYTHMFVLAETLATAIGDTVASRLPSGGAQTGGGGTAVVRLHCPHCNCGPR